MTSIQDTILKNLPVGLLIIGGDGKILEASPSACTILGCPTENFVGEQWGEIFLSREENLEFTGVVLDAIQNETPKIERVTPYLAPDGTKRYLSVISSTERAGGKISAIIVLFEDLTTLHHMHEREKHILEVNHRLAAQRADSLNSFARSVAHQIRNPLMSIAGFTRLLERNMDEASREPLDAIKDEAKKLETMVRAVAEYSSIEMGTEASLNLWVIIEDAKKKIEDHPAVAGQSIEWKAECPDMNVKADRDLIVQALAEVLLNAAEFGGPSTVVDICAREKESTIRIGVVDNGPGFTPDGLEMAFDPFFTTKTVGVGMGLTRARRIVNEHQGTMDIENLAQGGAKVVLTLPVEPLGIKPSPFSR
jgi:PAS domain S-box-containing protein